jgi:hypothetical protein
VINEIRKVVNSRLGSGGGGSYQQKSSGGGSGSSNDVVELTDSNFEVFFLSICSNTYFRNLCCAAKIFGWWNFLLLGVVIAKIWNHIGRRRPPNSKEKSRFAFLNKKP